MNTHISGEYIAGFVEGEGCFSINYNSSCNSRYTYLRPMFSVGVNKRDKKLLEKIRKKLDCGIIYLDKRKNYSREHDCYSYRVHKIADIYNKLIPFFDKYQFKGNKKIVFETFTEILDFYHSTLSSKDKHYLIAELKRGLNSVNK